MQAPFVNQKVAHCTTAYHKPSAMNLSFPSTTASAVSSTCFTWCLSRASSSELAHCQRKSESNTLTYCQCCLQQLLHLLSQPRLKLSCKQGPCLQRVDQRCRQLCTCSCCFPRRCSTAGPCVHTNPQALADTGHMQWWPRAMVQHCTDVALR
jgi:hypothetical protein